jgi:hypothetical protein
MPASGILAAVKNWLVRNNPICLMHPHGFYVVLLGRNETEEWRFHFWPKGARSIAGMPAFIHTHDRHVESRILQGQLINVEYAMAEVATGGQPLYEVTYDGDRYGSSTSNYLRRINSRGKPTIRRREAIATGEMYCVERHTYHQVVVSDETATATLVRMHGRAPGAVMVVGLDGYPETLEFKRTEHHALAFASQLSL